MLLLNKKILIPLVIFSFILLGVEFSQLLNDQRAGLSFISRKSGGPKSNPIPLEKQTTLNLTPKEAISFSDSLFLTTDISFNEKKEYGWIFEMYPRQRGESSIEVSYRAELECRCAKFTVISSESGESLSFNYPAEKIGTNLQHSFRLSINKKSKLITCSFDGKQESKVFSNFVNTSPVDFKIVNQGKIETPHISVKNISITADGKLVRNFPLDQVEGTEVHETVADKDGLVLNPIWVRNDFYHWKFYRSQIYTDEKDGGFGYFDKDLKKYVIASRKKICYFDPVTGSLGTVRFTYPSHSHGANTLLNLKGHKIYKFHSPYAQVSYTSDNCREKWSKTDTLLDNDQHCYANSYFYEKFTDRIYSFGGYGWYVANNNFQYFNFDSMKWVVTKFKGDFIEPRFSAAFTEGEKDGVYYIFGGHGNKTGKQEDKFVQFRDLYRVDFRDTVLTEIFEINDTSTVVEEIGQRIEFLNVNDFVIVSSIKKDKRILLRLYQYSIKDKSRKQIGEDLLLDSTKSSYQEGFQINSHYDAASGTMYLILNGNDSNKGCFIESYSIRMPAYTSEEFAEVEKNQKKRISKEVLIQTAGAFVFLICGLFFYYRKKKTKIISAVEEKIDMGSKLENNKQDERLQIFGQPAYYSKKGNNILADLPPKAVELFMLLMRYNRVIEKAFSSEKIEELLWPNIDIEKRTNNKKVTLSKLRKAFAGETKILFQTVEHKTLITLGEDLFIDLFKYQNILELDDIASITEITQLTGRGIPFEGLYYGWIEETRSFLVESATKKLQLSLSKVDINSELYLRMIDVLSEYNPLDEEVLSLKLKYYMSKNNATTAKKVFENFTQTYKRVYGEEFILCLEDLLKN